MSIRQIDAYIVILSSRLWLSMPNPVLARHAPARPQNHKRKSPITNPPAVHSTSRPEFRTTRGRIFCCSAEDFFQSARAKQLLGKVQLIFTSPPFPLNTKKAYGNLQGDEYTDWLAKFAPLFKQMLTPTGSIVLEMGNAWEPGEPVMSTLALEGLLKFLKAGDLKLAQQFICHNPARLPRPGQL